ncbi:hypothetical protein TNCV_216491 [Trichonephila clavipes]|nr:hypothetical protein TNCV_216491 [Trichonephila clavipes]
MTNAFFRVLRNSTDKLKKGDSKQHREDEYYIGCKPSSVGENCDNNSRRKDKEQDKEGGQMNAGIGRPLIGLKICAIMEISTSPRVLGAPANAH